MTIERQVKICCTNSIDKTRSNNQVIWRSWKIQMRPCQKGPLSSFIDHVEYFLHESFETPHIVCNEEPYLVQQVGWGEFDLKIVFHFRDNETPPETHIFDLNFSKANYSELRSFYLPESNEFDVKQTDEFKHVGHKKKRRLVSAFDKKESKNEIFFEDNGDVNNDLTFKRQRTTSLASASSSSVVTTPTDNQNLSYIDDLRQQKQSGRSFKKQTIAQNQQYSSIRPHIYIHEELSPLLSPAMLPSLHTDYILDSNSVNDEIPEEIDLALLKTNLESLEDDDNLRKVYDILFRHPACRRCNLTLLETKDHIFFDLNSLDTVQLIQLWDFTKKLAKQKHLHPQQEDEQQEVFAQEER